MCKYIAFIVIPTMDGRPSAAPKREIKNLCFQLEMLDCLNWRTCDDEVYYRHSGAAALHKAHVVRIARNTETQYQRREHSFANFSEWQQQSLRNPCGRTPARFLQFRFFCRFRRDGMRAGRIRFNSSTYSSIRNFYSLVWRRLSSLAAHCEIELRKNDNHMHDRMCHLCRLQSFSSGLSITQFMVFLYSSSAWILIFMDFHALALA